MRWLTTLGVYGDSTGGRNVHACVCDAGQGRARLFERRKSRINKQTARRAHAQLVPAARKPREGEKLVRPRRHYICIAYHCAQTISQIDHTCHPQSARGYDEPRDSWHPPVTQEKIEITPLRFDKRKINDDSISSVASGHLVCSRRNKCPDFCPFISQGELDRMLRTYVFQAKNR